MLNFGLGCNSPVMFHTESKNVKTLYVGLCFKKLRNNRIIIIIIMIIIIMIIIINSEIQT